MEEVSSLIQLSKNLDRFFKGDGKVASSYYVKLGTPEQKFIEEQCKQYLYSNIFHFDQEKGAIMLENELCSWMLELFKAPKTGCASVTSGGTESILVSVFALREYAKNILNISRPQVVCSESIHPGWIKACYYMNIEVKMIKINEETGLANFKDYVKNIS